MRLPLVPLGRDVIVRVLLAQRAPDDLIALERVDRLVQRAGEELDPSLRSISGGTSYMFRWLGLPASSLLLIPSRPAASIAAAARYGLAAPSTIRFSIRPGPGMRIIWVRLLPP